MFNAGDERVCFIVPIVNDSICEIDPNEQFLATLEYVSGILPITVDPDLATVIIDDTAEPECGKCGECVTIETVNKLYKIDTLLFQHN